jgi:cell division protein FtsL
LASVAHAPAAGAVAEPLPRVKKKSRPRTRSRKRARGGVLWIAVSGILLAGVVFVNVAVLRLNLAIDSTNAERVKLHAQDAALQSQLSSTLASPRIQSLAAKKFGLVYADPSDYGYVNLAP